MEDFFSNYRHRLPTEKEVERLFNFAVDSDSVVVCNGTGYHEAKSGFEQVAVALNKPG
jgi:hypothetical protein